MVQSAFDIDVIDLISLRAEGSCVMFTQEGLTSENKLFPIGYFPCLLSPHSFF